jgi:hypothetical protein
MARFISMQQARYSAEPIPSIQLFCSFAKFLKAHQIPQLLQRLGADAGDFVEVGEAFQRVGRR